ncbi:MAG: MerR family transcriptional regulator [Rhodococcus sp. (in: high G+C Gram-positive bacteria)]
MAWSTREIADLAGTSLRAVRHYHDVGLLVDPERNSKGYKQYGVQHLVRVLRIKRLTDLGFSLSQIAAMGEAYDHPKEELRLLDAHIAATIERLQQTRTELDVILRQSLPSDLPTEFAAAAAEGNWSVADRSFVLVMTRLLGAQGRKAYLNMMTNLPVDLTGSAFDNLTDDADEDARRRLVERLVPYMRKLQADNPDAVWRRTDDLFSESFVASTMATVMEELYNVAQLDVMKRVSALLETPAAESPG